MSDEALEIRGEQVVERRSREGSCDPTFGDRRYARDDEAGCALAGLERRAIVARKVADDFEIGPAKERVRALDV